MIAPKYSPLPWQINIRPGLVAILDAAYNIVTVRTAPLERDISNARLIITAVNVHAELLAAAKEALAAIEPMAWDFPRLKTAIANAEKDAP